MNEVIGVPQVTRHLSAAQMAMIATADDTIIAAVRHLKKRRIELGMTQAELAKRTGMTQPQIAKIENVRCIPGWRALSRYAQEVGIELGVTFSKNN